MKNCLLALIVLICLKASAQKNYASYVNPFIGTGGHGHTYPGATMPHGMVQLSPDTRLDGWDGCGGYHYSDTFIYGFSHTHLSGTGVSDYGDILLMPSNGAPSADNKIYGSRFSHAREKASAGFYSVMLDDHKILAELTTTERTGMHRYTFTNANDNHLILDLVHRDKVLESSLKIEDSVTISGLRRSKAWATNQYVYFVIKFSRPFKNSAVFNSTPSDSIKKFWNSDSIRAYFKFSLPPSRELIVKVAISAVSVDGAMRNMQKESPGWDFNAVRKKAEKAWNTELSKIEVESADINKLKIFYTALYHTAIVPNIYMDVDSLYRGRDNNIHKATDHTNYSVFSLWDTYRGAHPLYTITDRRRSLDYIKTFLTQYKQGGRLPVWELSANETDCMIGYHSVPVIVDAFVKGINAFDKDLALEAMKKSAEWNHLGLPAYRSKGMIEADDDHESVSKTLEYAYDDFCIGLYSLLNGRRTDADTYMKRAQYYKNLLDVNSGHMRPKKNGGWIEPFDPREVNNHFTEANSWQYSFYMPQDIGGYMKMAGGPKRLEVMLDKLFAAPEQTTGRDQSDITGLIGQYAHGNEPSHHIAYLYNYTGAAHKTQEKINKIMKEFYKNTPDGLIGNEDCGQMSAWYILSAMGFYPITPGIPEYSIGTPAFKSVTIHLESGKKFIITADSLSDKNFYIRSVSFTNSNNISAVINSPVLKHDQISGGGTLRFMMDAKPHPFPTMPDVNDLAATTNNIVVNQVIQGGVVTFKTDKVITINSVQPGTKIFYTLDGTDPSASSAMYVNPLKITATTTVKAIAYDQQGKSSFIVKAEYKLLPHNWTLKLNTPYEKQYDGGGADGLIDGLQGSADWRKGYWQGYQNQDPDIIIDLQKTMPVTEVRAGFLQDTRAWIVMPVSFTVEVSTDNIAYTKVYEGNNFLNIEDLTPQVKEVIAQFNEVPARYVRIKAKQYGKLPQWHEGAGGDTHIFIDEIYIKGKF